MKNPFEVRVEGHRNNEMKLVLLQERPVSPGQDEQPPRQVVSIWGTPLQLAQDSFAAVLRDGGHGGVDLRRPQALRLRESEGVRLGVLMFALKPMRKLERIRKISEAITHMTYEAACYWFSKAANGYEYNTRRRHMRALRILLAAE